METISESSLALLAGSRAIKQLTIRQNQDGRYTVAATITHQEHDIDLVTFRKKPREWASLDRLARHIQDRYGAVPIRLYLQPQVPANLQAGPMQELQA